MRTLILLATGALLLYGCHSQHDTGDLKLNNGRKWTVNAEMKPHIEKAAGILDAYVAQHSTDHNALAAQLKEQNDLLIQSCAMKGESHDELHKWLHPHIQLVDELAKAGNATEAEAIITRLGESFEVYQNFFE